MIDLVDDPGNDAGGPQSYKGNATVAGIWFSSTTNGDVALLAPEGAQAGAIEHLNAATTVDSIALHGLGAGFDGQDDDYNALWMINGTLYANSRSFGSQVQTSTDNGKTFKISNSSSNATPNAGFIWLSKDSAATWHLIDDIGNVWNSTNGPVPTATWTRTWQPEGAPPVPDPVPAADCQMSWHQGYFAFDAQQVFWVSPDGKTMVYNDAEDFAGVCRSTDGGNNFLPVQFPSPPNGSTGTPYVVLFTSATHGVAAYSNDLEPSNTAYVYTTDDAGGTWKAGTLPTMPASVAFTNGFAAPDGQHVWIGGWDSGNSRVWLMKSSDGGSTWKDISTKLAAAVSAATGSLEKLHSGFALDANNIWIGGDGGGLAYSPTGGE